MNKKTEQIMTVVTPEVFYHLLSKKDKSIFLDYLQTKFGFRRNTVMVKLNNTNFCALSKAETILIANVIKENAWKK